MAARAFSWIGGALFVASLSSCAWSYMFGMGRSMPFAGWAPLSVDAALITVFSLHHSLFARDGVKQWLARRVSSALERSVYVWIASLLLMLVSLAWQPIGG